MMCYTYDVGWTLRILENHVRIQINKNPLNFHIARTKSCSWFGSLDPNLGAGLGRSTLNLAVGLGRSTQIL